MDYSNSISVSKTTASIAGFAGLNRNIKSNLGEFSDMENMYVDSYPCISSLPSHADIISSTEYTVCKYIVPRYASFNESNFTGISFSDNKYSICVDGTVKRSDISSYTDAFDFNGSIITIPEFKGYNYRQTAQPVGYLARISPQSYTLDFTYKNILDSNNDLLYTSITFPSGYTTAKFNVGQSITLSGFTENYERNNTIIPSHSSDYTNSLSPVSVVITNIAIENNRLVMKVDMKTVLGTTYKFYIPSGNDVIAARTTISASVPSVSYACVNKNRVWCLSSSGETVYASALGKPLTFYSLGTQNTDSWYADVGTPGLFTGIGTYQDRVLAFKENDVHIIYGDTPLDFKIFRNYSVGCIDGKSIVNCNNMLIWLYHDGFYAYAGNKPQLISEKLNTKYIECVAFSDNYRYFARCKKTDNTYEFLMYDTRYKLWFKLSDLNIFGGEFYNGKLYAYTSNKVCKLFGGSYGDFYLESGELTYDNFKNKAVLYFYIRCKITSGFINVYTSVNGKAYTEHTGISKSGKTKLPIRYKSGDTIKFKIEGSGNVTITDIDIQTVTEEG